MICYLIRHGKDDDSVRGGWSGTPLTDTGTEQINQLADFISDRQKKLNIVRIFSSDLLRARQSAEIIAVRNGLDVTYLPSFREVNNGELAGMKNSDALKKYPNLFWKKLEWEEKYPNGESPRDFYERIEKAWGQFRLAVKKSNGNVALVTHAGVIEVILSLVNGVEFTNKTKRFSTPNAVLIPVEIL